MPNISSFHGMNIYMYRGDHLPPHFHVEYAEYEVTFNILAFKIIEGYMPRNKLKLVVEWTNKYRKDLLENWELCNQKKLCWQGIPLKKIPPLQ